MTLVIFAKLDIARCVYMRLHFCKNVTLKATKVIKLAVIIYTSKRRLSICGRGGSSSHSSQPNARWTTEMLPRWFLCERVFRIRSSISHFLNSLLALFQCSRGNVSFHQILIRMSITMATVEASKHSGQRWWFLFYFYFIYLGYFNVGFFSQFQCLNILKNELLHCSLKG